MTLTRNRILRSLSALFTLVLLASFACAPAPDRGGLSDSGNVTAVQRPANVPVGVPFVHVSDNSHPNADRWIAHLDVSKCYGEVDPCLPENAYEVVSADQNLLMTAGANQLWNGLATAGLATPWNTTNTQLVVGDASTAATAADTDMGAAVGTKLNAADVTSCSNATPVVCAGTYSPVPVTGQVIVISGLTGAGSGATNQTWEITAASGSTLSLLNSASPGALTITGALFKPINKYSQRANAAGSAVITTNSIVYVATFATTSANFAWAEWGTRTGAQLANFQASPPANLLDHAIPGGGLGTKTSAASWTLTVTLSLS